MSDLVSFLAQHTLKITKSDYSDIIAASIKKQNEFQAIIDNGNNDDEIIKALKKKAKIITQNNNDNNTNIHESTKPTNEETVKGNFLYYFWIIFK